MYPALKLLVLSNLGYWPFGESLHAFNRPEIPVYSVVFGDDGYSWARRIAETFSPASRLARQPGSFAVDAEPVKDLWHLGSIYNVWLYNLTYTPPSDPNFNLVVNSEGPFRISVISYQNRITLHLGALQPSWVVDHLIGRSLWDFLVVLRHRPSLRLPPDIIGSEWLESRPAGIQSIFLDRGVEYSILARGVSYSEADCGAAYLVIYLVMAGDPQDVRRLHGEDIPLIDGPWQIKPIHSFDRITLFDYKRVPVWVQTRDLVNPSLGGDFERVMLRDFVVRNHHTVSLSYMQLMLSANASSRSYEHTCAESSIHYFVQPISRIEVQIAVMPESRYASQVLNTDDNDTSRTDSVSSDDHRNMERPPVSQRLEVYMKSKDRVIALSELTDKVNFQFDQPADRPHMTEHSVSQTLFLLICVLTGQTDGTVSVRVIT